MLENLSGSSILLGGAAAGFIAAFWEKVKTILQHLFSLIFVTVKIENNNLIDLAISNILKNYKPLKILNKTYNSVFTFSKSKDRNVLVSYQKINAPNLIFRNGFKILFINGVQKHIRNEEYNISFTITFLRGTLDPDKFISEIVKEFNDNAGNFPQRFFVTRVMGKSPSIERSQPNQNNIDFSQDSYFFRSKRILNFDLDDITSSIHNTPIKNLAFPEEIKNIINEIKTWKESRDWFKEKGIPWKRGILLYGLPGTGKTSLVRSLGQEFDFPIWSFDLSTLSNEELITNWNEMLSNSPCIALFEDIDATFKKRENISKQDMLKKPLSFDCLLNCIDGIYNSNGILTFITTNNIDHLDDAIASKVSNGKMTIRPGRIDRIIHLTILDEKCRLEIAERILSDFPDEINKIVQDGDGDTGAQFQERCSTLALNLFWKEKI